MPAHLRQLSPSAFPPLLSEIPDPPDVLYAAGTMPEDAYTYLAVVGSRKHTPYGKEVCEALIRGLAGYPIAIVSGLALGLDAIAHRAALAAGLPTIAVPGSGLNSNVLYPAAHRGLAKQIVNAGGALLSEFPPDFKARPESFPQRNRIMAGISHAVLVIEAAERSGSLITARLAAEYNRDVLAVPGSIFAPQSRGTNGYLKLGAQVVTESADILAALSIEQEDTTEQEPADLSAYSENEQYVLTLLEAPQPRDALLKQLDMPVHEANTLLAALELKGCIVERLGNIERRI